MTIKTVTQSRSVATVVYNPFAAQSHVQELHTEVRAMTRTMSNFSFCQGYQAGFDGALRRLTLFSNDQDSTRPPAVIAELVTKGIANPPGPFAALPNLEKSKERSDKSRKALLRCTDGHREDARRYVPATLAKEPGISDFRGSQRSIHGLRRIPHVIVVSPGIIAHALEHTRVGYKHLVGKLCSGIEKYLCHVQSCTRQFCNF